MVSITRRDGTLMDASSISEEDIVEICVKQGHTHPLGVLCYSAAESVVLFLTMDDLKCASCNIAGETKLHDEAIPWLRQWLQQRPICPHMQWFGM